MFEELFARKALDIEKTIEYGFVKDENGYTYETDILGGAFQLQILISQGGSVDTNLMEKDTGEEYTLYKTTSTGAFVGEVRAAVESVLTQVAEQCYRDEVFKTQQAKDLISYVREKYGDDLEFLWKKFPDNAVWRRKDTTKWYGAILTVAKNKLGLDSTEIVEIIDLRIQPDRMQELLLNDNYYPGWHMNKKNWYTIILDGSVDTEEICRHIDVSYSLAL